VKNQFQAFAFKCNLYRYNVASISAKGEVVPGSPAPDVAVIDPNSAAGSAVVAAGGGGADDDDAAIAPPSSLLAGRAAAAVAAVVGGACVSPEFFKSWLSRPEVGPLYKSNPADPP
jgi:topoisomerase (DNA) II binding protein 1